MNKQPRKTMSPVIVCVFMFLKLGSWITSGNMLNALNSTYRQLVVGKSENVIYQVCEVSKVETCQILCLSSVHWSTVQTHDMEDMLLWASQKIKIFDIDCQLWETAVIFLKFPAIFTLKYGLDKNLLNSIRCATMRPRSNIYKKQSRLIKKPLGEMEL